MNEEIFNVGPIKMEHEITVFQLKEILNQLEDDYILIPNKVGNLSIIQPRNDEDIGFIDLLKDLQGVEFY